MSEVEILKREGRDYYKGALFVGFSDRDLIEGVFTVLVIQKLSIKYLLVHQLLV